MIDDNKLTEMRAHAFLATQEQSPLDDPHRANTGWVLHEDVPALIAEVKRLREALKEIARENPHKTLFGCEYLARKALES